MQENKTIKLVGQGGGSAAVELTLGFVQEHLGLGVQLFDVPMATGRPNPSPSVQRASHISGIVEWQALHDDESAEVSKVRDTPSPLPALLCLSAP